MALRKVQSSLIADSAITGTTILDGSVAAVDLSSTAIADKLGYTPVSPTQLSDGLATKQDTLISSVNIKTINGESILGDGNFVLSTGDTFTLSGFTTNDTETELFVDGESNNRIQIQENTTVYYNADIICKRTNGEDYSAFTLKGVVNNNANNITDIGSVYEIIVVRTDATIQVDVRANSNNGISVYVTGVNGKSLSWTAQVTLTKV